MKSIKLNRLNANELDSKSANQLRGGNESDQCKCGCYYDGQPGGSSILNNRVANRKLGLSSPNFLPEVVIRPKPEDPPADTIVKN